MNAWIGAIGSLLSISAMGALGVAILRRGAGFMTPVERVAYGVPLGVVVGSLALVAVAPLTGFGSGEFLTLAAGMGALAAWRSGRRTARAAPSPAPTVGARGGRLLPALVLGAFGLRWAVLWLGALSVDGAGLHAGFINLWGDWSQHLGDVTSFAYGDNFPPTHPRMTGAPFAYHYLSSVTVAAMVELGMSPLVALPLHSFLFSVCAALGIYAFAARMTRERAVAALALLLFMLGGGLGWWLTVARPEGSTTLAAVWRHLWDFRQQEAANFRWQNVYFALIGPQRGYLYGIPLGLLTLTLLFEAAGRQRPRLFLGAGLVAGLLPLAHLGTLLTLALMAPCLVLLFPSRGWLLFFAAWIAFAAPQLYVQQGGGLGAANALRWQPGWVAAPDSWGWFWLKNLGAFVPLLGLALADRDLLDASARRWLWGFMPLFVVANLVVFQPWDWDNTKVLVYWFLAVCILVAAWLARAWRCWPRPPVRLGLTALVATMVLSGILLNLNQLLGRDRHLMLTGEEMELAEAVRTRTPPRAVFAVGLQHNHPVPMLAGRRVVMSYPGWLWSQGMDYAARERDLREMFALAPRAPELFEVYRVDYVVIGPEERARLGADSAAYRARYPRVIRTAGYEVFAVRPRPRL